MQIFLRFFLGFILIYHLFITLFVYGVMKGNYYEIFSLSKEILWILYIAISLLVYRKSIKSYLKTRYKPILLLLVLIGFGIGASYLHDKSFYDMFIGFKYWFMYILIFLSATWIGYNFHLKKAKDSIQKFINFLKPFLYLSIIASVVRQLGKFIFPDFFQSIGYGAIWDYIFGQNPPLYYRTWPWGSPRFQGIFSWPNNYGYFLIAFLPLVFLFFKQKFKDIKDLLFKNKAIILNIFVILLWILAILLTLSRTAFIGGIVGLMIINHQRIKHHKKLARSIWAVLLAGIIGLSIFKWSSTIQHIQAKFSGIQYVIDKPGGYGLGTAWPAINYNGTILPENYYIQIMIDIGTIGFLIRLVLMRQIMGIAKKIQKYFKKANKADKDTNRIYLVWKCLTIGWISLLIMWIFLHVFEDSMINYLFFISRGIVTGYLSNRIDKSFAIKW